MIAIIGADPKWRFFWRMGDRPTVTKFPSLNAEQVVPRNFPEWPTLMNSWGSKIHDAVETLSQMVALGLGMPSIGVCKQDCLWMPFPVEPSVGLIYLHPRQQI